MLGQWGLRLLRGLGACSGAARRVKRMGVSHPVAEANIDKARSRSGASVW